MIKKTSKDSPQEAKNDFIVMAVIALVLIFAFAYLLINIVGQFEKHVQKVRDTKVQYEDSLNWRPDKNLCERRIRDDYENNPNQEKAEYTQLELSENAIVLIGKMIKLKELSLEHSIIEDDWLKHLVNLPLTSLILSGTNVTDNGIPLALKLKDLKVLKLSDTTITDKSLELIAEVPRIKVISVDATKVTDDGIKYLERSKGILSLNISDTKVTSKCLQSVAKFKRLINLNIGGIPLTAEALEPLTGLKRLRTLEVGDCDLQDSDMKVFKNMPALQFLNVSKNNITDNGLMALSEIEGLSRLELKGCSRITEKSIAEFKKIRPHCKLKYSKNHTDLPKDFPIGVVEEEMKALEKRYLKKKTDKK